MTKAEYAACTARAATCLLHPSCFSSPSRPSIPSYPSISSYPQRRRSSTMEDPPNPPASSGSKTFGIHKFNPEYCLGERSSCSLIATRSLLTGHRLGGAARGQAARLRRQIRGRCAGRGARGQRSHLACHAGRRSSQRRCDAAALPRSPRRRSRFRECFISRCGDLH